jgi:hypothetical protein
MHSPPVTLHRLAPPDVPLLRTVGIWPEFGACPLAFIEYLLIGVASLLFPDDLLNEEGVSRRSPDEQPASPPTLRERLRRQR